MSQPTTRQIIAKQVTRARRRLIAQVLLRQLAVAWAIALALAAFWMLAEPYAVDKAVPWLSWAVLGGTVGVLSLVAVLQTIRRAPSRTDAALALDDRFGLRERTVTVLSLTTDLDATPAGVALLADAESRIKGLKVREKFPVGLPWSTALVPAGGLAVALVALFYHPSFPVAQGETAQNQVAPEKKKEIEKKLEDLAKKPRTSEKPEQRMKSEDLKRLEARLDEIAKKPRDTREQLRDRIKELTPLEEEYKKLEREKSEKARMLQQQLQAKDKMMPNDVPQDGPAKEFSKALAEGDLDKAKEQLDKLTKKLENNELSEKEKEQLGKQLDDVSKKMERLAEQKDKQEQLKKLAEQGKLDPETLQREMEKIKKSNEMLKDLQKLANKLGKCQQCLKKGEAGEAAKALSQAGDQLSQMGMDEKELEDLKDQLDKLKSAKDSMCKACDGDGQGEGDGNEFNPNQNGGGGRQEGAMGRRPDGEQGKIRTFDARQQSQFSPKGQKIFDGYAPGQAFKSKPGSEMVGEIQQAAQQAPDAIEVQRIPKAARDMAKGYFKNLGGQKDDVPKEQPKEQPKK
jgi:septal ring factor EnvC (AmiA/AmiB activator)